MNNTNNYFDYLHKIWDCVKIKDAKEYLENIKINFHNLNKNQKNKYIEELKQISYCNIMDEMFVLETKYKIYRTNKAIRKLILDQLIAINSQNSDMIIDELLEFLDPIIETHKTKIITKKDIDLIFKTIKQKMPNFENILTNIDLDILIFNNSHKYLNSETIPSQNLKHFKVICFYMQDNDKYKQNRLNPIYVFLHELGHIICWIIANKNKEVPKSFFTVTKKYMCGLEPNNPDALEVFADCFAMAIMYNTQLNCYNPFALFEEELFIDLEKYFSKIITELQ